ncbi:glycosyltransferase family 2 protein [Formosa agariphila]|nr:glycosyltransferase family 2 protein [Formosa agariphila]
MIFIGVISVCNFFYWFIDPELIDNPFLFGILVCVVLFDSFRLFYIWYHYWNISIPKKPVSNKKFTVDVLTTYFPGEPIEMVIETLLAIEKNRYPHTTYLCDEANDPFLKSFCKKNGIIHVTRNNRKDAKAGNINNALAQAKGELCLVLDPDHIPEENFIEDIIPYFEDNEIGFVQTVQAYYNIDESKVAKGAAQQTFQFYGPLMMGMNSYGTVNAIGANCVFRRTALDSIGGHAAGLSEDMHTAMKLNAEGWKSVYVPKSYTKGLVPATLVSYYQQQLKWSKGTFELLLKEYPKLFKKFTWRQKLHYAILPFHYLSGFIFLLSFLIPIFSLLGAFSPLYGNVINFALMIIPIITCVLCIRYYVQQWVVYKEERGMHILGGLLFQVTWWVFFIGVVFNFIGKQVIYLPTIKSDFEKTPFRMVLPNIILGIISLIAIVIGLQLDFTPFSIVMAGFALWNALLMFFTLVFAYEKRVPYYFKDYLQRKNKGGYKVILDYMFSIASKISVFVVLIILGWCGYIISKKEAIRKNGLPVEITEKKQMKYLGAFLPKFDDGITNVKQVSEFEYTINESIDIVSFYYPWHKEIDKNFSISSLDSVYNRHSVPMITWEPWLNTFTADSIQGEHVFDLINDGYFDDYLSEVSLKFKSINKPVFLRFAHEFDNPFYPWFDNQEDADIRFKKAWIHVHDIFIKNQATNVIWVWNPWKAEHVIDYFPGEAYVDWVSANILNYAKSSQPELDFSFKVLYDSFHNEFKKLPKKPVMISEFGALRNGVNQNLWISNAFNILHNEFEEIQAIVFFNSKVDDNLPDNYNSNSDLDWTISIPNPSFAKNFKREEKRSDFSALSTSQSNHNTSNTKYFNSYPENIKGINFRKGENWNQSYYVLSRKNLESDFKALKKLGLNTIRYKENDVYDINVLNISAEFNLNISYGFHIPEQIDFIRDTLQLKVLEEKVLNRVEKYKKRKNIIVWEIENDVLVGLKKFYDKPELQLQQEAYLIWLNNLMHKINKIDKSRPITLSIDLNNITITNIKKIENRIKLNYTLGLIVNVSVEDICLDSTLVYLKAKKLNYVFSSIDVNALKSLDSTYINTPYFITSWQDQHEMNVVSFKGLIDRKGRYKTDYFEYDALSSSSNKGVNDALKINILKPAKLAYPKSVLIYHVLLLNENDDWIIPERGDLEYEWLLVKKDKYGNRLAIEQISNEKELYLTIPNNQRLYELQLSVVNGDKVYTCLTALHTPYNVE